MSPRPDRGALLGDIDGDGFGAGEIAESCQVVADIEIAEMHDATEIVAVDLSGHFTLVCNANLAGQDGILTVQIGPPPRAGALPATASPCGLLRPLATVDTAPPVVETDRIELPETK